MQTIKITITSQTPTNIVLKECKPKDRDLAKNVGDLLKKKEDVKEEKLLNY